jgi:phage gpG-like protein
MAGAGITVSFDANYNHILDALKKASMPDLEAIADFMGGELHDISSDAFRNRADPVTGKKWEKLKDPYKGSDEATLHRSGILEASRHWITEGGTVVYGTNLQYGRIHQEGGKTSAHKITARNGKALSFTGRDGGKRVVKSVNHPGSDIPARPYMGVPDDFDRRLLDDPAVIKLLGLGG